MGKIKKNYKGKGFGFYNLTSIGVKFVQIKEGLKSDFYKSTGINFLI